MSDEENTFEEEIDSITELLKDSMEANEYKNYIIGLIFYKGLSDKVESYIERQLRNNDLTFKEAYENEAFKEKLEDKTIRNLGYFIKPEQLFSNMILRSKKNEFILDDIRKSLSDISKSSEGYESEEDFSNIFEDIELNTTKLGRSPKNRNKTLIKVLLKIDEIDFEVEDEQILEKAYDHLISQYATDTNNVYSSNEVAELMARIVTLDKESINSVYDPLCANGYLLLKIASLCEVSNLCGQEANRMLYNFARMNMIQHNIRYNDFDIKYGDCIENPKHMDQKFDAISTFPEFSKKWSADDSFNQDPRFAEYGKLAPKSRAEYTYIQHMLYHLTENGSMAIVLPPGVLYRGSAEGIIRTYLIEEKNYLDAVIGLPGKLFYGSNIETVILVFKKQRSNNDSVLFIDASKGFQKVHKKNKLRNEDINKILNTYIKREEIEKYSRNVSLEEIKEKEYNLNVPLYIETIEEEKPIDFKEVSENLIKINKDIKDVDEKINECFNELNIKNI